MKKLLILLFLLTIILFSGCVSQKLTIPSTTQTSTTTIITTTTNPLDNFAECITSKRAVMYGAVSCPHCQDQKTMFGDSFKYVNYVECPDYQVLCNQTGITGYPTWIINGVKYTGTQTMEKLSELTGCSL